MAGRTGERGRKLQRIRFLHHEPIHRLTRCRGELAVALQAERPVIPVQLDATELPAALRLQIGNRQAIIRSRFTETEYRERLTAAVLAFQNAPPTAERDATIFERSETGRSATKRPSRRVRHARRSRSRSRCVGRGIAGLATTDHWRVERPASTVKQQGLVVLPFENGSPQEADAYLSEGFSDELRDQLSRVQGLRVVARPSSIVFRGQNKPASLIAKELGVATVVEGSLRKDGDSLRIVVRLIDGTNDTQLWSQRYDRKSSDLLAIQQEVALAATRQILPQVDPKELPRPEYQASVTDLMMLARTYQQKAVSPEGLGQGGIAVPDRFSTSTPSPHSRTRASRRHCCIKARTSTAPSVRPDWR